MVTEANGRVTCSNFVVYSPITFLKSYCNELLVRCAPHLNALLFSVFIVNACSFSHSAFAWHKSSSAT